jgi:hypothetical protein
MEQHYVIRVKYEVLSQRFYQGNVPGKAGLNVLSKQVCECQYHLINQITPKLNNVLNRH